MLLLTGEPGVGKTLFCLCLLERLGGQTATAFLTNSHFRDRAGLLQAVLYDLSLPYEGRGEQEMRLALTDHLLKHFAAEQKPVVLIVDEAQHLDADLLEELRLLANLEAPGGRALQVVLAAQPSIAETLRRPELAALRQRLAVRAELGALAPGGGGRLPCDTTCARPAPGRKRFLATRRWNCWPAAPAACRAC